MHYSFGRCSLVVHHYCLHCASQMREKTIDIYLRCVLSQHSWKEATNGISALGIGCGLSMVGLGVYMYLKLEWESAQVPVKWTWFPVFCIFAFTITCTLGFLVVPWVMIGELYPQKVRGIVGGMTTCFAHIFVFIVVKTYPMLTHVLAKHGTFITYGCISLIGEQFDSI